MSPKNSFHNFEAYYIPEPNSGCWLWLGPLRGPSKWPRFRYGSFKYHGKHKLAHRFSYEFFKGSIPQGFVVDHICCVHVCVNPDHLELVTHAENIRRGHARRKKGIHPHANKVGFAKRPSRKKSNVSHA